jgi:hypothetical protein
MILYGIILIYEAWDKSYPIMLSYPMQINILEMYQEHGEQYVALHIEQ